MTKTEEMNIGEARNTADEEEVLTPEMIVHKYAPAILGFCIAHTKNFHDSEDIMQDVLLKAVSKLNTIKDRSRVRSWLFQIARRMCLNYSHKCRSTQILPDDIPAPVNSSKYEDEHIIHLHKAISKLPKKYRETICLYYLDGQKCSSVARNLDISEVAVRRRLVRARLMLHDFLVEDRS